MIDQVNQPPPPAVETPAETPAKAAFRHTPHGKRILGTIVIVVLGLYALVGAGAGILFLKLRQGPLDATPVIPVVQKLISHSDRLQFRIGDMQLVWHGHDRPLGVTMENVHVIGQNGEYLTIGHADLGVSIWRLLLANLHFGYARIDDLSLRVTRLPDGTITLTGEQSQPDNSQPLELDNIVRDLPGIDDLTLDDMRIVFEDRKDALVRRFDDVNMQINQTHGFAGRSLSGHIAATMAGAGSVADDGSKVALDFNYKARDKTLDANATIDRISTAAVIGNILRAANLPLIDMPVQGHAQIRLDNDFHLLSLDLHLSGDDGTLYWPHSYGEGLENQKLTRFDLQADFAPETRTLELNNAEITIKGITLALKGALSADAAWDTLQGNINASIPVLAVDALPAVWPKIWESGARQWLVDRMNKGRFAHIDVGVPLTVTRVVTPPDDIDFQIALQQAEAPLEPETGWHIMPGSIKGSFDFTGITVDYRAPLLPARNTTGTGIYEGLGLKLNITTADIGGLHVNSGTLEFDDLVTPGKGHAYLHFDMKGGVGAVFQYLSKEPIAYQKKVALDASQAKGQAQVAVDIDFPTLHDMGVDDVHVKAKAKLTNLVIPGAVKGMTLAGPSFDLDATQGDFHISGKGTLDGQPATIDWQEYFTKKATTSFASNLSASIDTDSGIRRKFIGSLEDRIEGIIPADVTLKTANDGKGALNVSADLTDAVLNFTDPLGATKAKGQPAKLKLTGTLQNGLIQSIDTLGVNGAGMAIASGSIGFRRDANGDATLAGAKLNGLRLGRNDCDIDASWSSAGALKAMVSGTAFDAGGVLGGDKTAKAKTAMDYDINLKLAHLYLADQSLDSVTAALKGNTGGMLRMINLTGAAAGTPVTLRYDSGGLLFDLADAGAGLSALGISQRVRGGTLHAEGMPGKGGNVVGKLVLKNFSVTRAPVLAKLINLLSLPGLLNILEQDTGLKFQRAEADITLRNGADGFAVSFKDGRTSGASLGLTFEGTVDIGAGTTDIHGTVVPMSEVNSLLSAIPLVGDILTGGAKGGGIFAATYAMKGPIADPNVSINPLSVLTPGILRRILFEGAL
ncbi:MAG: hypothetical protein H6865_04320 [Rhodospirillales bacterium]|nr:hypothetical protein [Alphaproteobacteria bacterium]MCB9986843.1 hypothetical protein [Rhodospirillales bacterium]USO08394.1 MAG: hypothetical protein H6866_04060 [Rhodospirillales bacterium]